MRRNRGVTPVEIMLLVMIITVCVAIAVPVFTKTADLGEYTVTGYCQCEKCCGIWATKGVNSRGQRVTASGHVIQPGDKFIAAPPGIPFGTVLDVPGYGRAAVEDRGGSIKGRTIDVYFCAKAA